MAISGIIGGNYFNNFAASLQGASMTRPFDQTGLALTKCVGPNGGACGQSQAVSDIAPNNPVTTTVALNSFPNVLNTPEPMTSVLLGSGLLALGYLLRRHRRR